MGSDPRIGTTVAGHRIEGVLGRGGQGVVYVAEHLRLGRKVALKILPPELAQDTGFRDRFVRESRIAAGLDHPNIVPVYDADEADGMLFISMRYVPGTDLRALLRGEGRLDLERTVAIVEQVARALDAAHAAGLVHRDVKPGNVLIVPATGPHGAEHCYLADFGLGKRTASDTGITAAGHFVGTIDYVAPEQIRGQAIDGRADVYALGCVLYECLTGSPPFRRDSEVAAIYAHMTVPPPRPSAARPELPAALDDVVVRAMAKEPADRFPSAGEMAAAARGAIRPPEAEAARPTRPRVPTPPPRRRRWLPWAIGAAAGVAVAAGIVGVILLRGGDGETPRLPPVDSLLRDGTRLQSAEYGDLDGDGIQEIVVASTRRSSDEVTLPQPFLDVYAYRDAQWRRVFDARRGAPLPEHLGEGVPENMFEPQGSVAVSQAIQFLDLVDFEHDGQSEIVAGVATSGATAGPVELWIISMRPDGELETRFYEVTERGGEVAVQGDQLFFEFARYRPSDPGCCPSRTEFQTIAFDEESGLITIVDTFRAPT